MWFVLRCKLVGEMARTRHSVFEAKVDVSTLLIKKMMIVDRASRGRRQLRLLLCLFLNLSDLDSLSRGSRDLHPQDNVSDLRQCLMSNCKWVSSMAVHAGGRSKRDD